MTTGDSLSPFLLPKLLREQLECSLASRGRAKWARSSIYATGLRRSTLLMREVYKLIEAYLAQKANRKLKIRNSYGILTLSTIERLLDLQF